MLTPALDRVFRYREAYRPCGVFGLAKLVRQTQKPTPFQPEFL